MHLSSTLKEPDLETSHSLWKDQARLMWNVLIMEMELVPQPTSQKKQVRTRKKLQSKDNPTYSLLNSTTVY